MPQFDVTTEHRDRAKRLRSDMSDAERKLWSALRAHRFQGLSFRRQVPIGPFIADFVCHAHRLIIEVDGGQHAEARKDYDDRRTAFLARRGYRVVRFWNNDVLTNLEGVLTALGESLASGLPHDGPPPYPPPQAGEGSPASVSKS